VTVNSCVSRSSKFVIFQAIINKKADVIEHLLDMCTTSSAPSILQSDHRQELQYHRSSIQMKSNTEVGVQEVTQRDREQHEYEVFPYTIKEENWSDS
jgi:hypothetical protein